MLKQIWCRVRWFLNLREWTGIGVLVALPVLGIELYQLNEGIDAFRINSRNESVVLDQEQLTDEVAGNSDAREETPQGSSELEFSITRTVRCPGGGHIFNRERNRRTTVAKFEAPPGMRITETPKVEVLKDHYGGQRLDWNERSATLQISCDPPNFPGAPGGWMSAVLKGTYGPID